MERLHHPCLVLKISSYGKNELIEGCLDFQHLLKCYIDIIPLKSGIGFGYQTNPGSVKIESKNGETIITFISSLGFKPTKLYISNEYWSYNNINQLIAKYKSMNLM